MLQICQDLDPEQCIAEEYKHKLDPIFCWRFLRLISCVDLVNFHLQNKKFEGNIEEQAEILHKKGAKRPIKQERTDEDCEMQEEGAVNENG